MIESYKKLLRGNQEWSAQQLSKDPKYFEKMTPVQNPEYLWIGCSDSRVPAETITGAMPGEIFVHRNIANLVVHTDLNLLSVLEYAVKYLKVKHIILCGHYGCGGVKASMENVAFGYVDNWLRNIKEVYARNSKEIEAIAEPTERVNRMVELNVIEQVHNLCKTKIVQKALRKQAVEVHGWVYGIHDGEISELINVKDIKELLHPIFSYHQES